MWRRLARWLAVWLSAWADPPQAPPADAVVQAVRAAMADCGVSATVPLDFDLLAAGKLKEVLYHAAKRLDRDGSLRTVRDVVEAFER